MLGIVGEAFQQPAGEFPAISAKGNPFVYGAFCNGAGLLLRRNMEGPALGGDTPAAAAAFHEFTADAVQPAVCGDFRF